MKRLQEYIYEVSDELLDRAAKAAQAKANDKSLSKYERGYRANQARTFTDYKWSDKRSTIYQKYEKKQKVKGWVKNGIKPTTKKE